MRRLVLRYALVALIALAGLVGLALLVRPLIYTVATPRDDTVYAVGSVASIGTVPTVRQVLINEPHGLLGEQRQGQHAAIWLAVSRTTTGEFVVVNAWSPASACPLAVAADRFRDCSGHAWTFAGDPITAGDRALQRFPVVVEAGSLLADLTRPVDAAP